MLRFTNVDHKPIRLPPVYGYRTHPLLPLRQALDPIMSRIDELDKFIKIAKTECHFPSEHGLTREESASIYIYTMDWGEQSLYLVLNEALRVKDRSVLLPWHGYLKLFDTALQKLPSLNKNLWRGINLDISQNFKEGEELTWWSFSSCASAVKVVKQFLGPVSTLLMIEAKNGKLISAYSNFPEENEVILGLGTRLRVVSDALDHPSLNVVHLVELSDGNDGELSSSLATMSLSQPVKTAANAWINNTYSTSKIHTYADGSTYEGEWKDRKKHGTGTYCYADGSKYTGSWVDDQKAGEGVFTWTNECEGETINTINEWLLGRFVNGNFNGKGTKYFADGNKYVGDWIDDKMAGEGVFTWRNGDRYEGQFVNGKVNGKGTKYFVSGNKYVGDWINDKMSGHGVYTWPDDSRYEGQFKGNKFNGKGTKYFVSGNKYVGDWIDDKMAGQGVYTWPNGSRYEGQFKDSKFNGKGKIHYADGQVQEGMWSNDNFLG